MRVPAIALHCRETLGFTCFLHPPKSLFALHIYISYVAATVFQGYMVLEEGENVTPIESYFFLPWLSKYAEKGGVSFTCFWSCGSLVIVLFIVLYNSVIFET